MSDIYKYALAHPERPVEVMELCQEHADEKRKDLWSLAKFEYLSDECRTCDECEAQPRKLYLIEMAWFCWDCAENIGFSFVEEEKESEDDCYRSKGGGCLG